MIDLPQSTSRRAALGFAGMAAAVLALDGAPAIAAMDSALPAGAVSLSGLAKTLAALPRRRAFTRVPFLVDTPDLWDHEAAGAVLAYRGQPRQVWENSEISAAWINLMREAMNGQVFAHGHPDFLPVSATHGNAHLALFNQAMWDKYGLADRTAGLATHNSFILEKPGASPADDRHDIMGFYGIANNNVVSLQRRGAVFIGCHDTIHAISRAVHDKNPATEVDVIAADLTNNLIPGVVLVPSVVAFLVELQRAGFTYVKGA